MLEMIENLFLQNFVVGSLLITAIGMISTIFLIIKKVHVKYQFTTTLITILLLLSGFWLRLSTITVKNYSYILPIAHLIIVLISGILLFNSIKRYQTMYSKIELRLVIFYLLNYLVWFILFLQDIFTIGVENVNELSILPYLGWIMLNLSLAAAVSIYYIGKSIFFMKYKGDIIVEGIMLVIYGFILGITLGDIEDSLIINSEKFYQQTFFFPDLFKPYSAIIVLFLFIPYLVVAYKARSAISMMNESNNNGGRIDPVAIPRLKMTEISMYVYILGAGFAIGLTILPGLIQGFALPFGLNTILSVPFIALVDLTLFLAFQTPDRLKTRWRQSVNVT